MTDKTGDRQLLVGRTISHGERKRGTNNIQKTIPLTYNDRKVKEDPIQIHNQPVQPDTQGTQTTHIGVISRRQSKSTS